MSDQQTAEHYQLLRDQQIHAALDQHWADSAANDY